MIVETKHGNIEVNIYSDHEGLSGAVRFFRIIATKNGQEMGHLNFRIKDDNNVWIYHIETKEEFAHQGAAQAEHDVFEAFCASQQCRHIEGRYYPTNSFAKPFYEKNGYDIFEDSYEWFIAKGVNQKEIKANILPKISGEMELLDYKAYEQQKQESQQIVNHILNKMQSNKFGKVEEFKF